MPTKQIVKEVRVLLAARPEKISWWKLVATNGETLAHSEVYSSRRKAMQTAKRVAEQLGVEVKEIWVYP